MKLEQPKTPYEGSEEIKEFEESLPDDPNELIEMRNVLRKQMRVAHQETEGLEALHSLIVKVRVISHKLKELSAQTD